MKKYNLDERLRNTAEIRPLWIKHMNPLGAELKRERANLKGRIKREMVNEINKNAKSKQKNRAAYDIVNSKTLVITSAAELKRIKEEEDRKTSEWYEKYQKGSNKIGLKEI